MIAPVVTASIALALMAGPVAVAGARPAYVATPGPHQASASFTVAYEGSGAFRTGYHSRPPNPGGKPDNNHVTDSSTQEWKLTFRHRATFPTCVTPADGVTDPCAAIAGLSGAIGATSAVGNIHHVHVDGLYRADDRALRCTVRAKTGPRHSDAAMIAIRYDAAANAVVIVAGNPVTTALGALPGGCPHQGDSLDLLLDNYFTPGFSFATGWGADRWFTSRPVTIPMAVLHDAAKITIPVGLTAAGTPPRSCAVAHWFEHCSATGTWTGVITLAAAG